MTGTEQSSRRTRRALASIVTVVLGVVGAAVAGPVYAAPAPRAVTADTTPGSITLAVTSARSVNKDSTDPGLAKEGDPVTAYRWLINVDDVGDPGTAADPGFASCLPGRAPGGSSNPDYADTCPWPSTRPTASQAPIVAQGDESTLATGTALQGLPPGKYLISVKADGFKIDGAHFTVAPGSSQRVAVTMDPTPLPLATIKIQVFEDSVPVDGTYEVDAENNRMTGFSATLTDVLGLVTTDYYGNALCTAYVHDASGKIVFSDDKPVVDGPHSTGKCLSDANGVITIPNLGPNRYGATVTPPSTAGQGFQWVQTTTLEGTHDHDIWVQEGDTGLDTEILRGQEPVPAVQFGFVKTQAHVSNGTGSISGVVVQGLPYIGGQDGQVGPEGVAGVKVGPPIKNAWVALSDLNNGDRAVYVGKAGADGRYSVSGLRASTYQVTLWDDDMDFILDSFSVTVEAGQSVAAGQHMLVGWMSHFYGSVFVDDNGNGVKDPGEKGIPGFVLTLRERDNSLMDQMVNTVSTNDAGVYDIREGYPLSKWVILEAFNTRYRTTGVTWQGENDPEPTTQLGGLVDLNVLPILGLGGRVDWGVEPYPASDNGGIAGTVTYDVTRNELDAADAAAEPYQPGVSDIPVHLYLSVPCAAIDPAVIANECRQGKKIVPLQVPDGNGGMVDNTDKKRGEFVKGPEVADTYTSETWAPPRGCTARMWDGTPLTDQLALPDFGTDPAHLCVEAPMMGMQAGASDSAGGSQTVNGNYGFAEATKVNTWPASDTAHNPDGLQVGDPLPDGQSQPLAPADYIVGIDIPDNPVGGGAMYKVTSEEDVNVFTGDTYLPQENFPPATAADAGAGAPPVKSPTPPSEPPSQQAGIISACVGPLHTVHVTDQDFLDAGGSPFEGYDMPSCQDKLVTVRAGQTTAPNFSIFTEVPIPTHFWGLTINDLGLTLDKRSVGYGEAQGLPFVPVGLYDWSGRLRYTAHTDFNGMYEALVPSTGTYNCPVPAGPCPNMYRFVGNDPGYGTPNPDYNPRFRTISATFQGWPGLYTVTDTAPTQVAATVLTPDTTATASTTCDLPGTVPQLLAVNKPYIRPVSGTTPNQRQVVLFGKGFGTTPGTVTATVTDVGSPSPSLPRTFNLTLNPGDWTANQIKVSVPASLPGTGGSSVPVYAYLQLEVRTAAGLTSYNTLSVMSLESAVGASGFSPTKPKLFEVGTGATQYHSVQRALDAASADVARYKAVIVWPNAQGPTNPRGDYNENIVVHNQVRIQGIGPGGFDGTNTFVRGSVIDGSGFNIDLQSGADWLAALNRQSWQGPAEVPDAAVVTVLAPQSSTVTTAAWPVVLDGLQITGGTQADTPGNVNIITGGVQTPYGAAGAAITQGGGIYVHYGVANLHVSNNLLVGNGGAYGGAIRVGTPYVGDNHNYDAQITRNQIRDNGGTNLAGGIGLFTGSDGYRVQNNAICGNHSSEYGGAISAFGYQANNATEAVKNSIDHNRIWFNASYDEGGAVMVAGELPATPDGLSPGTGPVAIDANVIQGNLANDDGGAIRLLQTTGSHVSSAGSNGSATQTVNLGRITITNNTIANNVSAHEGAGIALDDAAFVDVVSNTVVRNLTTATALTSNGLPAPAGLSTATLSDQLRAKLGSDPRLAPVAAGAVARPTIHDDLFWDNRAGTYSGGVVTGITATDAVVWDIGIADVGGTLTMTNTAYQSVTNPTTGHVDVTGTGTVALTAANPGLASPYDVEVNVLASRQFPAFRQAAIVTVNLPFTLLGNYDLTAASPAVGRGAAGFTRTWPSATPVTYAVVVPPRDIHGAARPTGTRYDLGSDQL